MRWPQRRLFGLRGGIRRGVLRDLVRIARLQVEEPLALMATNEWLITVEAQPLTATLLLLRRREATELSNQRQGSRGQLCNASRCGRGLERHRARLMPRWSLGA
jgi:hypothetical protein